MDSKKQILKDIGISLLFYGALIFAVVAQFFSSGCGASFPNAKPQMIFKNCQIIQTDSKTGNTRLVCSDVTSDDSKSSAKDSTIDNSKPGD